MTGRPPRGLSTQEAALWAQVAATVTPLHDDPPRASLGKGDRRGAAVVVEGLAPQPPPSTSPGSRRPPPPSPLRIDGPPPRDKLGEDRKVGLDASWERKLARAHIEPELTIDLHGLNLEQAHARLLAALGQALARGARLVLLIAGKPRPGGEQPRGERRGAIRAKLLDWLAASEHAARIAAVRPAHPRHGGAGAVYVVLRRAR